MRRAAILIALALAGCNRAAPSPPAIPEALAWAYPKAPEAPLPKPPPGVTHVPGSAIGLTQAELSDDDNPPDWFPASHPPAPPVAIHKRKDGPPPCAACHLMSGGGFLGAPDLAGLPAAYIVGEVKAFRSGERKSAEPGRPATGEMIGVAAKVTNDELAQAAAWFAALPRAPRYRVVETDRAPATRPDYYGWLDRIDGKPDEPIGERVVEVAEDPARMFVSDPHSGVVVYAPSGAVARGEALVRTGGGGGQACAACHGADLRGTPVAPPLAGRSAAYLTRMLWDIRTGARAGPTVAQMQQPARGLEPAQIRDVAVYLASLQP